MFFKNAVEAVQESSQYEKWRAKNKEAFLSYAFFTVDGKMTSDWQIGYYSKKKDQVYTFSLDGKNVLEVTEDKVFKHPKDKVRELDPKTIKHSVAEVFDIVDVCMKEHYAGEMSSRILVVLNNAKEGPTWNVTVVSGNMKTISIRIGADDGRIREHKEVSFFSQI